MERRPQSPSTPFDRLRDMLRNRYEPSFDRLRNRGRSGMVARSSDGHKTNTSLGAELLDGVWDNKVLVYSNTLGKGLSFLNHLSKLV